MDRESKVTPPPDTPDWVADAVFYQIFPDRFAASGEVAKPRHRLERWEAAPTRHGFKGGDLLGIVDRLDYLEALGVNAIYLNPIFSSASNHRYHTYDYLQVDPLLGGNSALRRLLDAAHGRGMRVILDGVFNHTGRGFWAFHHLLENGKQSPYVDWFTVERWPVNAYGSRKKPNYLAWWEMPALPKLNLNCPEAREHVLEVAEHWVRFGIDGWRLDVPAEIDDPPFWREFRLRVRNVNPEAYLVGEFWEPAPDWVEKGDRFDGLMNYPFARTALGFTAAASLVPELQIGSFRVQPADPATALAQLEEQTHLYHPRVVQSQLNLVGSHDTPRFRSLASGDPSALRLAVLLQMTIPGAPCVYYGDEVGMDGGADPGCRGGFPWQEVLWDKTTLEVTRRAIALRHGCRLLRFGDFESLGATDDAFAFLRRGNPRSVGGDGDASEPGAILVALNASEKPTAMELPLPFSVSTSTKIGELWATEALPAHLVRGAVGVAKVTVEIPARDGRLVSFTG